MSEDILRLSDPLAAQRRDLNQALREAELRARLASSVTERTEAQELADSYRRHLDLLSQALSG
jgi:hypothetical protein